MCDAKVEKMLEKHDTNSILQMKVVKQSILKPNMMLVLRSFVIKFNGEFPLCEERRLEALTDQTVSHSGTPGTGCMSLLKI